MYTWMTGLCSDRRDPPPKVVQEGPTANRYCIIANQFLKKDHSLVY